MIKQGVTYRQRDREMVVKVKERKTNRQTDKLTDIVRHLKNAHTS